MTLGKFGERQSLRAENAAPLLNDLKAWLDDQELLAKSLIGKAATYTRNQWAALSRYLEDGDLAIENNISEQCVKPAAIGRKNWLFLGSAPAGRRAARLISLVASCKDNQVEPWAYLRDLFTTLPQNPKLESLLPDRWLEKHPQHRWTIAERLLPLWILFGEPQVQVHDHLADARPADGLAVLAVVPLSSDEFPMPSQNGIRREQGAKFPKQLAAEKLAFYGQASPLIVGQQNALLPQLLPQNLVFGPQIVDRKLLLAIDPSGQDDHVELPGLENEIHACSGCQTRLLGTASGQIGVKSSGRNARIVVIPTLEIVSR